MSIKDRDRDQKIILVTGGARSGKSRLAHELAINRGGDVVFIATAAARDDEMRERIEQHKRSRPPHWKTVEEEVDLVGAMEALAGEPKTIIIDCITLWISNLMEQGHGNEDILQEIERFRMTLLQTPHAAILVTNEVGSGIVPENARARRFRDLAGEANQMLASCADECYLMAAGIPVRIKPQYREA